MGTIRAGETSESDSNSIQSWKKMCGGSGIKRAHYWMPEELILEILTRIPANHVVEFKKVCKSWYFFISHPVFQNPYLERSRSGDQIMLTTVNRSKAQITSPPLFRYGSRFLKANQPLGYHEPDLGIFSVNLKYRFVDVRTENVRFSVNQSGLLFSVKASCDGLLLLCDQYKRMFLHNPVLATYKHLPDIVDNCHLKCIPGIVDYRRINDWILFYDTTAGKYKVGGFRYQEVVQCHFMVLTVGEDHWQRIPYWYYAKPLSPVVVLDNKLHWLTFDSREADQLVFEDPAYHHTKECFILVMDATEIQYWQIPVPIEQVGQRHLLSTVKGSLCIASFSSEQLDIIVLEGMTTGLYEWKKMYSATLSSLLNVPPCLRSFLCYDVCLVMTRDSDGGDFSGLVKIFIHNEDHLIYYDLKHQDSKIIAGLSKEHRLRQSYHFYSPTFVRV